MVPKRREIDCMNLIIKRLLNLKPIIYYNSNDHLGIEDKSSYQEIHKLKQKYYQMFYCYMEQYERMNMPFEKLLEIEKKIGLKIPREVEGTGLGIVHEVWNFSYKWNKSEIGLRFDFMRLLAFISELHPDNDKAEIKRLWFKFMWRIVRHHILRNFKVNPQELERHYPRFKLITTTKTYLDASARAGRLHANGDLNFDYIVKCPEYKQYLKHMSIIQLTYKAKFEEAPVRKDWLADYIISKKNIRRQSRKVESREEIFDYYSDEDFIWKVADEQCNLDNIRPNYSDEFSDDNDTSMRWNSPVNSDFRGKFSNLCVDSVSTNKNKPKVAKQKPNGEYGILTRDIRRYKKVGQKLFDKYF